ncbi:MAG TPA: nitroreductase family protein [Candidatus Nanoarchaeia archaeon]|nr:nitroreductase family protein [Candidatus Nanoarchaeia archaeon]
MDIERCFVEKRSCKSYLEKSVSIELIGEMIKAGTTAPSAGNLQNWQFIVVREEQKRNEIAAACHKQEWMRGAPVHIIICNDVKKVTDMFSRKGKLYATQACAIAGQNIMLKATDLGLSTCWVGSFDEYAIAKILKIPDNSIPEMIITVGYSDQLEQGIDRLPVDKVTFFEEHGKNIVEKSFFPLSKYGQDIGRVLERATGTNQQQESQPRKPLERIKKWFKKV